MSTFFGMVRLDGGTPDPAVVEGMSAALAHLPRGAEQRQLSRHAAFGSLDGGDAPASGSAAELERVEGRTVAFAGWLDPREHGAGADQALARAAFVERGADALIGLDGDHALAAWDEDRGELWCQRDQSGLVPLYYSHDARQWLVSTDPAALLAAGVSSEPDEVTVASLLAGRMSDNTRTLYKHIKRLPPGHRLYATARAEPRIERVSRRDFDAPPRTQGEQVEHFRHLFFEAVRARSRSAAPLAVDLSGGLDSSSVVVAVDRLARDGRLGAPSWDAYSLVFPGMQCDERRYIDAVLAHVGSDGQRVEPRIDDDAAERAERYRDMPDYPNGVMAHDMYQLASARGCRVVLGGCGGDEWLGGTPWSAADRLLEGRWGPMLRDSVARVGNQPRALARHLLSHAIGPWIPATVRSALRPNRSVPLPDWIAPDLSARTSLPDRLRIRHRRFAGASHAQSALVSASEDCWSVHANEMETRAARCLGLELRYPFMDRRLAALCLTLPEEQRRRGETTKWILRRAMGPRLPELVRERRDKASFAEIYLAALRHAHWGDVRRWRLVERGWIRAQPLENAHRAVCAAASTPPRDVDIHALWCAFALESWLKAIEH